MKNFKIIIEYDGTGFNGWQIQSTGRTVQGEIEKAVSKMTRQQVRINASGRTDAGVHAVGQVAAFRCDTTLSPETFFSGLNCLLPDDIVILSCDRASDDFHPRYDATAKTYHYKILNRPLPGAIGRPYFWHIKKKLDVCAMTKAISLISGTHDFKAFENTGSPRSHTFRTIYKAGIDPDAAETDHCHQLPCGNDIITIHITANGFLRYMVRNIVGTLVDVGQSKLTLADFAAILAKKDRGLASATAPPQGLFLINVQYGTLTTS